MSKFISLTNRDQPKGPKTVLNAEHVTGIEKAQEGTHVTLSGGNGVFVVESPDEVRDAITAATAEKPAKPEKPKK